MKLHCLLAQYLVGEFENKDQAWAEPVWFVHLRLWHRPLPRLLNNYLGIFAEQAPVIKLDQPYRQRIMLIKHDEQTQELKIQYLAFKQPEKFKGAGVNAQLLETLTPDDLETLPGCALNVNYDHNHQTFVAQPHPDDQCYFQYQGQKRQVILGFEVNDHQFQSYDRGVDPETGQLLWGALMGAYKFAKIQNFSWTENLLSTNRETNIG